MRHSRGRNCVTRNACRGSPVISTTVRAACRGATSRRACGRAGGSAAGVTTCRVTACWCIVETYRRVATPVTPASMGVRCKHHRYCDGDQRNQNGHFHDSLPFSFGLWPDNSDGKCLPEVQVSANSLPVVPAEMAGKKRAKCTERILSNGTTKSFAGRFALTPFRGDRDGVYSANWPNFCG